MRASAQQRREQSARAIAELIEQLSRSLLNGSSAHHLNAAQWSALRYLGNANESARQIGAFAKFHLTTPSSASQTIGSLVKKGMVVKTAAADGRRRTIDLTSKGRRVLKDDPIIGLANIILSLPDAKLFFLAETMQMLVQTMHRLR
jgi:DNA-binding MarR family transcriptional regulator